MYHCHLIRLKHHHQIAIPPPSTIITIDLHSPATIDLHKNSIICLYPSLSFYTTPLPDPPPPPVASITIMKKTSVPTPKPPILHPHLEP
ncbi:hypothetical protein Hanom_Chr16g01514011 [Helianthus anomalus]